MIQNIRLRPPYNPSPPSSSNSSDFCLLHHPASKSIVNRLQLLFTKKDHINSSNSSNPNFSKFQNQITLIKMTGGKSGGKASGSKSTAQSYVFYSTVLLPSSAFCVYFTRISATLLMYLEWHWFFPCFSCRIKCAHFNLKFFRFFAFSCNSVTYLTIANVCDLAAQPRLVSPSPSVVSTVS